MATDKKKPRAHRSKAEIESKEKAAAEKAGAEKPEGDSAKADESFTFGADSQSQGAQGAVESTYECGDCGAALTASAPRCTGCGRELNWGGLT